MNYFYLFVSLQISRIHLLWTMLDTNEYDMTWYRHDDTDAMLILAWPIVIAVSCVVFDMSPTWTCHQLSGCRCFLGYELFPTEQNMFALVFSAVKIGGKGFVQFMLHGYEYDMFRPQTHKETEQQHPFWRVLMYFEVSMPYPICVRHNTTWTGHQFLEYLCFLGSITLFAFYTNILHWADLYPCTMSYHLQNSEHLEQGMNYSSFPQKNFLGWGLLSNYAHILEIWVLISMLLKPIRHLLAVPYIVTFLQVP